MMDVMVLKDEWGLLCFLVLCCVQLLYIHVLGYGVDSG